MPKRGKSTTLLPIHVLPYYLPPPFPLPSPSIDISAIFCSLFPVNAPQCCHYGGRCGWGAMSRSFVHPNKVLPPPACPLSIHPTCYSTRDLVIATASSTMMAGRAKNAFLILNRCYLYHSLLEICRSSAYLVVWNRFEKETGLEADTSLKMISDGQ